MTKRRALFFGLGAAVIGCAAVLAAFLLPPMPDLMARSKKITELGGKDEITYPVHWLDRHHLVSVQYMALATIDVSTNEVTFPSAVNAAMRRYDVLGVPNPEQIIPSPDGQWLYCDSYPDGSAVRHPCVIRMRDGRRLPVAANGGGVWTQWQADSRHWVTRSWAGSRTGDIYSLDDPLRPIPAPPLEKWSRGMRHLDAVEEEDVLSSGRMIVREKGRTRKVWEVLGCVSPDRTRIAWLRQRDWLSDVPDWVKSVLKRFGYVSHTSGEVWTTRIDGTNRQDLGQFTNEPFSSYSSNPEIDNFGWTPDGKSLIFTRSGILYSVPVSESNAR